jgi:hypothetical protein
MCVLEAAIAIAVLCCFLAHFCDYVFKGGHWVILKTSETNF